MSYIVGVLTFLIIVNCILLVLLVLIQLPKKDAGAGLAFGGGAADALFGAGSGNVLTKITKYATIVFFALALLLGLLQDRLHRSNTSEFEKQLEQKQSQLPVAPPPTTPPPTATSQTNQTGFLLPPTNAVPPAGTPPPAAAGTNTSSK